jgi:hypothetical protein
MQRLVESKDAIRAFLNDGDDNAKDNSDRARYSTDDYNDCTLGWRLRTPPRANEGLRGGKRTI